MITYASLQRRYGKGEIIRDASPIRLVARLDLVRRGGRGVQVASAPFERNAPTMHPTQLRENEFDKEYASTDDAPRKDILEFKFVLTTAGANQNDQVFLEEDLRDPEVLNSMIGQAVDWDHDQSFMAVCGEIRTSEVFEARGDVPMGIRCTGVIFADLYPEIAKKIMIGAGTWAAVSMEALPNPLERMGKYLVIHRPVFVGAGLVRFPGNKFSVIEEVDGASVPHDHRPVNDKSAQESSCYTPNLFQHAVRRLITDGDCWPA